MPPINPPPPVGQSPRDTELLEQLARARARGDAEAERTVKGELLGGWLPHVERLAVFKGFEPHQVGDVVGRWAERMLKLLADRTSFDGPFGAVAMLNAGWACGDERRDARHRDHLVADPRAAVADVEGKVDAVSDVLAAVDAAVARLSERERAIVDAFFAHDRRHKEIAEELGTTEGAAKTALCRALNKVRVELREAGVTNRGRRPL